jgi:hypothetical protein
MRYRLIVIPDARSASRNSHRVLDSRLRGNDGMWFGIVITFAILNRNE